ncbi:MAG: hypothetical protein ACWA5Q_03380 [bacterium]
MESLQTSNRSIANLIWIILLFVAMVFTYTAYNQSSDAGWTFDDAIVLGNLSSVNDISSASSFIFHNQHISINGRPISMATFLLNKDDWPDNPAGFRQLNYIIHLLNALLIFLIAGAISKEIPDLSTNSTAFASLLSITWMLHPFLASTSFHLIQRMTLLSAFFTLIGILIYLWGRKRVDQGTFWSYAAMISGLFIGIVVGSLAKENAILTAFFLLSLEATILRKYFPALPGKFRPLLLFLLWGPVIFVAGYAVYYGIFKLEDTYYYREFTPVQRLASEAVILFDYLGQVIFPDIFRMGPIQDDSDRIRSFDILSISAIVFWLTAVVVAIYIRKSRPFISFAILLFLTAHLLESTIFSLELYFEHRNYLAIIGIISLLVGAAWRTPKSIFRGLSILVPIVLGGLLWQLHSLWSNPKEAAINTYQNHPSSTRATQNLVSALLKQNDMAAAYKILVESYVTQTSNAALASNLMQFQCLNSNVNARNRLLKIMNSNAESMTFSRSTSGALHKTVDQIYNGNCNHLTPEELIQFTRNLLRNPRYKDTSQQNVLSGVIIRTLEYQGDHLAVLDERMTLMAIDPTLDNAKRIQTILLEQGKAEEHQQFLHKLLELHPAIHSAITPPTSTEP